SRAGLDGVHHDVHGRRRLRVVPGARERLSPLPANGVECLDLARGGMPLYTADALVLRTYKLGEADRIVVFLTSDRGKKRGVAKSARRPRSRFTGALEPLT